MFIEVMTINNEKISLNINNILNFSPVKKGTRVYMTNEEDFTITEGYEDFKLRLRRLKSLQNV